MIPLYAPYQTLGSQPHWEPLRVLFVCGTNAAWSIMAEALLRRDGGRRFLPMSAGIDPAPAVDPMTLDQLASAGLRSDWCFTKSILTVREDSMLRLDFICSAMDLEEIGLAGDWPGHPAIVHWNVPDPMEYLGRTSGRRSHFRAAFTALAKRIDLLTSLPQGKVLELRRSLAV